MKKILVIIQQANLTHLTSLESLSAMMVLATFGHQVHVLFKDAGLSLLQQDIEFIAAQMPFKVASNMVDSFEYYDILPILIESKNKQHHFVVNCNHELELVELNANFLQQYQQIITF